MATNAVVRKINAGGGDDAGRAGASGAWRPTRDGKRAAAGHGRSHGPHMRRWLDGLAALVGTAPDGRRASDA